MPDFGIATVASITALCYLLGLVIKTSKIDNKWIPVCCGVFGAILGAVGLAISIPDFPATDYITACAVGVVSGLAATGINQIIKQLSDKGDK